MTKFTNGYGRAVTIATGIGSIVAIGFTLGMCPKMSEIQTTVEAKMEHDELEKRVTDSAVVQHDRIDAVLAAHKQNIELQRAELREYRRGQEQNRELIHETQKQILRELRKAR